MDSLKQFFDENPKVALGFSGGVDSSYLLYAGVHYGAKIRPYYIKTAFQPQFELDDAKRLCAELGVEMTVIELDILSNMVVAANPSDRCYYCKTELFGALKKRAVEDGYRVLIDGTNASDDAGDRPGMRALTEMEVRSPLRECGITKPEVRRLSKEAGLFTWDKPAYACLATRIPSGKQITAKMLSQVEMAENALFELGFTDFRVRVLEGMARIQVPSGQMAKMIEMREEVCGAVGKHFKGVMLDLAGR